MTDRIFVGSDGNRGVHVHDSLRGPAGPAVFEPLTHEQKIALKRQATGVPPVDLYRSCTGADLRLQPAPPMDRATRRYAEGPVRALAKLRAANAREYVQQQNAIDAPFDALLRERFRGAQSAVAVADGAACERSEQAAPSAALTELDPFKTKGAGLREEVEIDVYASRVRRLKKAVQNSAHILDGDAHTADQWQRWRRLFVTLTYRSVDDWKPGHVGDFRRCVRDWFRRKCSNTRFRMVWVLELQKRGAVHYHCMIWVRSKDYFPNPAKAGWWPHGFAHVLSSKVSINRPVAYMAKYCSKVTTEQAMSVPKGARMHGVCGLKPEGRRVIRFWRAPLFVRDHFTGNSDIRKVNGGYMDKLTGEFLESPWKVTVLPSGRVIAWREIPPQQELAA